MKKKLLLSLLLLCCQLSFAGIVTKQEAQQKAAAFISKKNTVANGIRRAGTAQQMVAVEMNTTKANYYVFNVGETEGFVVVSGDDRTPAILGYADEGSFDAENIPENIKFWLQSYTEQLDYLNEHVNAAVVKAPSLDEHNAIAPLLTCRWDQSEPYNNMCPVDGSTRSVTGCMATSMAQVLYYHKHPTKTKATIPSYTTSTNNIKVAAISPTTIDWDNMLDSYSSSTTTKQKNAVALLMKLCGASVKMDYTNYGSGAYSENLANAFINYFDYDPATKLVYRNNYRAKEWNNMVYEELANNRPVVYNGQSTGGGHSFVVDGYSKNGLFHVNWGWGGYCNGYFLLSILDPGSNSGIGASSSTDGYSFGQDILLNVQPASDNPLPKDLRLTTTGISTQSTSYTKSNNEFNISFTASIYNQGEKGTFDIGVGVYSPEGELKYSEISWTDELKENWGYNSQKISATIPTLPDGKYIIVPISRISNTEKWLKNDGSNSYYLAATISGTKMTLKASTSEDPKLSGKITTSGSMQKNSLVQTQTTIENLGNFLFQDELYLMVDNEICGGQNFEVEAGESDVLEMSFTPTETGTKKVAVGTLSYYYDNSSRQWKQKFSEIASTTIEIGTAKSYSLSFSKGSVLNANSNKVINSSTANIQVTIKNNSSYAYNDYIKTYAFYEDGNNWSVATEVNTLINIGAGESKIVQVDVPNLSDGVYWFIMIFKTNGEFISVNNSKRYATLFEYTVSIPTEIDNIKATDNKQQTTVYSLSGQKIMNTAGRKGIYIMNGKKFVIK